MAANVEFDATGKHKAALTAHVVQDVMEAHLKFLNTLSNAIGCLVEAGQWGDAIRLTIEKGRVSEADLARGLEVTRSTVNRWVSKQTVPQSRSMGHMVEKIQKILRD